MIWLDLDDTLWDMKGNARITLAELYHARNLSSYFKSEEEWIELYEVINKRLWSLYNNGRITEDFLRNERFAAPLRLAGVISSEAKVLAAEMDPEYLEMLGHKTALVPGARQLLDTLSGDGHRLGVLTNGFRGVQQAKMASSGITDYFDCVVLSNEAGYVKPDPRLFRFAECKSGVPAERCLMVGDSLATDIQGAFLAGWKSIWYNPSGKTCNDDFNGTMTQVATLAEVAMTVRHLRPERVRV